jgi:hypothetical protein
MTAEEQRIIGQLQTAVEDSRRQAEVNRQENRADFQTVFAELRELKSNGCSLGARNSREIEKLRDAPARAVSIGAALMAIISGIGSVIAIWRN